ncbi:MAG: hypothetical protein IPK44_12460 [Candidatus Accumulibacter sp.]|nr:hypothetical protein [Accumulibacter sp.]MBK8115283.1 hypothetical protein [Accumulibacter sp.]
MAAGGIAECLEARLVEARGIEGAHLLRRAALRDGQRFSRGLLNRLAHSDIRALAHQIEAGDTHAVVGNHQGIEPFAGGIACEVLAWIGTGIHLQRGKSRRETEGRYFLCSRCTGRKGAAARASAIVVKRVMNPPLERPSACPGIGDPMVFPELRHAG